MTALERRAIERLVASGLDGISASILGSELWPTRRGHVIASQGGGDYAAQMLLGRLRKRGWARVTNSDGSSRWAATSAGRRELALVSP